MNRGGRGRQEGASDHGLGRRSPSARTRTVYDTSAGKDQLPRRARRVTNHDQLTLRYEYIKI